jgi:hypothetical protein
LSHVTFVVVVKQQDGDKNINIKGLQYRMEIAIGGA